MVWSISAEKDFFELWTSHTILVDTAENGLSRRAFDSSGEYELSYLVVNRDLLVDWIHPGAGRDSLLIHRKPRCST